MAEYFPLWRAYDHPSVRDAEELVGLIHGTAPDADRLVGLLNGAEGRKVFRRGWGLDLVDAANWKGLVTQ